MTPHIGIYWNAIRKEFPHCEHASPLPPIGGPQEISVNMADLPLPRVWLINKAGDRLLQIQRDAFFYNWRSKDQKKIYPRYKDISKQFRKYMNFFFDFIKTNEIGNIDLHHCELTYVNHIPQGEGWKEMHQIGDVFPSLVWKKRRKNKFLSDPEFAGFRFSFNMENNSGKLDAKINPGVRRADQLPIIIFELSASSFEHHQSLNDMWDWYDIAHRSIVCGFADLTDSTVQEKVWQRDDNFQ